MFKVFFFLNMKYFLCLQNYPKKSFIPFSDWTGRRNSRYFHSMHYLFFSHNLLKEKYINTSQQFQDKKGSLQSMIYLILKKKNNMHALLPPSHALYYVSSSRYKRQRILLRGIIIYYISIMISTNQDDVVSRRSVFQTFSLFVETLNMNYFS